MSIAVRNLMVSGALLLLPAAAVAATVTFFRTLHADQYVSEATVMASGDVIEYRYNVLENMDIAAFALSATGNGDGNDVFAIRFGFYAPGTTAFTTVTTFDDTAFAGGFLPGLALMAGDVFSVFFDDGIVHPVALTLSFQTNVPSQVPVPAPGLLLGAGLLGLGLFATRRKMAAGLMA